MPAIRPIMLAAAALLSLGAGKPALGPAPKGNWLTAVAVSPSGSHLIGSPTAQLKLVEYISYTCPHCAHFQRESEGPLQLLFIQPGKVQVEVRHLVRDPIDMTVALLTNCGAPTRFAINHSVFLRTQDTWMGLVEKAGDAQRARWNTGPNLARMRAIASDLGFYAMMTQRGYDRVSADRCLADDAMARRLAAQTQGARVAGVNGTPGFLLDGVLLAGTYDWESLKPQIEARL
jgi:protein-disulfide isomerase